MTWELCLLVLVFFFRLFFPFITWFNNRQASPWYVSNVSIIFSCSMLLYYHSWMFYYHSIGTLYHFLGLTYWHSAQCQLLFFACFFTSQKINTKRSPNAAKFFGEFFWARRRWMCQRSTKGVPPGAPWWVVPTSMASHATSLLYKYPNIPETLGEVMKNNSSRRKFQKP